MVTEELKTLIAAAGRKHAERKQACVRDRQELNEGTAAYELRKADAVPYAREIFAWAASRASYEIRVIMIQSGLETLALHSDAICLTQIPSLRASNYGKGATVRCRNVTSPVDLVALAGPDEVLALADDIRTGRVLDKIVENLRAASDT